MKSTLHGKPLWGILIIACISGCREFPTYNGQVPDLIAPEQLNLDTTVLYLNDYFIDPSKIDSLSFSKGYAAQWDKDKNTLTIIAGNNLAALSELTLWSKGNPCSVLLKKSQRKMFEFHYYPKGKPVTSVQLAGEMNDWNPKKSNFQKDGEGWKIEVALNPGAYQYQLVVDGKWMLDPANPDSAGNGNGGFNSVFKTPLNSAAPPKLATVKNETSSFTFTAANSPTDIFAYYQNTRLKVDSVNGKNEWRVKIPFTAKPYHRSYIRVFACNEAGVGNDLLVPLSNGEVIYATGQIDRGYKQAQILYSILVDRFCDGDSSNDKPVKNPDIKPKANYYGGDLQGIYDKIEASYFDSFHVSTIWISPILQNPEGAYREFPEPHDWYTGYHGYWPISLTKIDYHFGSDTLFKKVVDEAHLFRTNVLVDLVANHVHEECPIIKEHPNWKTQLDLPDGRKNIRLWDEYRLTTWFDTFLPTLDFTNDSVVKMEVDSAVLWIEKYGVDGFRHDATKHISERFWRALTLRLKEEEVKKHKPLYQIGETYGSKELIGSYIGSGLLDGQFDFNLYFVARRAFAMDDEGFEKLAGTLQESLNFYGSHHLMGNITGNDDQPRFISLAGGALSFDEDPRKAGWDRNITAGSDAAYDKMACLLGFISTIPGIPVINYGDEIGMPGAGDPDNRRMMKFGNLLPKQAKLKEITRQLFAIRASHMSLIYGDFTLLTATKTVLAYQRNYFDETAFVIFNKDSKPQAVSVKNSSLNNAELENEFGNVYSVKDNELTVELPAKSFAVFIATEK